MKKIKIVFYLDTFVDLQSHPTPGHTKSEINIARDSTKLYLSFSLRKQLFRPVNIAV